jgi:hypothetical protein
MAGRFSLRTLDRPCFTVRGATGQVLAYVYFEDEPGRRAATRLMTRDKGSHLQCICKVGHSP